MRIDTFTVNNAQTQGARRRDWLRQHSPGHLEQSAALMLHALRQRPYSVSRSALVLGAGACTEVPLADLARDADEVVLVDLDLTSLQQARDELSSPALRKRVRPLTGDITGGVSAQLNRLLAQQSWNTLLPQGARAVFDAAAFCLEECPVPDPPYLEELDEGEFGVVISSFVLSQLFSYPLLDALDFIQRLAPHMLGEQERHRRYQDAAQSFRTRIIQAHLHLLRSLLDTDGLAVLLTDLRGFVFNDPEAEDRRTIPLVPRTFPELVEQNFTIGEQAQWEWITDLPEKEKLGRGYEVVGYLLK